jgi:hypothetical protein
MPIDISITHPDSVDEDIIEVAATRSTYFRSLAVMLGSTPFTLPLMDLPMLENLVLHSTALNSSVRSILQMADERAPKLHNLCLEIHSSLDFPLTDVARYQFYYRLRSLYLATGKSPSFEMKLFLMLPNRIQISFRSLSTGCGPSRIRDAYAYREAMDLILHDFTKSAHADHSRRDEEAESAHRSTSFSYEYSPTSLGSRQVLELYLIGSPITTPHTSGFAVSFY